MENHHCQYACTIYSHKTNQELHAVAEISYYQGHNCLRTDQKICRNLENLPLTPRLLYYELSNGFPTYPTFDQDDFGGYSYNEISEMIEDPDCGYDFEIIAYYVVGIDHGDICFYFDHMNENTRKLFEETMQIIVEESQFSNRNTHCKGVKW